MLNLAAQELNLVPREDNYVNPFRESVVKNVNLNLNQEKTTSDQKMDELKRTMKKKEKKEVKKGPRMSKKIEL